MKKDKDNKKEVLPYTGRAYAYISVGLIILSAVFFGLAFFTVLGIYSLIGSIIFSLAALAFANIQKKKNNFKQLIIILVIAYIVLGITVGFFIGGIIWAANS